MRNFIYFMVALFLISPLFLSSNGNAEEANNSKQIIINADSSLQWLRDEQKYIASGNAHAKQGDMALSADTIIAHYENNAANAANANNITYVEGQKNAVITRGDFKATATNIIYDIGRDRITLSGKNIAIRNRGESITAAKSITYDRAMRRLSATGKAAVKLSSGTELSGETIEATLNKSESDIISVTVSGRAKIFNPTKDGNQEAYADTMSYDRATSLAILSGSVRMIEGASTLSGDRAEINTETGNSTLTSNSPDKRARGIFQPTQN